MHLRITFVSAEQQESLTKSLLGINSKEITVADTTLAGKFATIFTVEPSLFREINSLVKDAKGDEYKDVTIEIVDAVEGALAMLA